MDVAYDSVGGDTFEGSLEALATYGHLVNLGQASGPVEPFPVSPLFGKSNTITWPNVFRYFSRDEREAMVKALFHALATGVITAGRCHETRSWRRRRRTRTWRHGVLRGLSR